MRSVEAGFRVGFNFGFGGAGFGDVGVGFCFVSFDFGCVGVGVVLIVFGFLDGFFGLGFGGCFVCEVFFGASSDGIDLEAGIDGEGAEAGGEGADALVIKEGGLKDKEGV